MVYKIFAYWSLAELDKDTQAMNAKPEQLHSNCADEETEARDGDSLPSPPYLKVRSQPLSQ